MFLPILFCLFVFLAFRPESAGVNAGNDFGKTRVVKWANYCQGINILENCDQVHLCEWKEAKCEVKQLNNAPNPNTAWRNECAGKLDENMCNDFYTQQICSLQGDHCKLSDNYSYLY